MSMLSDREDSWWKSELLRLLGEINFTLQRIANALESK